MKKRIKKSKLKRSNSSSYLKNLKSNVVKSKLSQVTVFIIVAIIIVITVALFFLYKSNILTGGEQPVSPEVTEIYSYVQNCVKDTGEKAVYYIGQTGGYFNSPEFSTDYGIPYYYSDGKSYIPAKENIEKELSLYMNFMLQFCIGDFKNFSSYKVVSGNITTTSKIDDGKVTFDVNYPLAINKGEKTYNLKKFSEFVPVRLDKVYELAYKINQEQLIDGDDICISCMHDWSKELDLFVEMNDYGNKTGIIIFTIRDANSQILDRDYRFYFANKYKMP